MNTLYLIIGTTLINWVIFIMWILLIKIKVYRQTIIKGVLKPNKDGTMFLTWERKRSNKWLGK